MRKIKITIETSTNMPTRNWFKPTCFVDLGMALNKDEGGRMKDEVRSGYLPFAVMPSYSSTHHSSLILSISVREETSEYTDPQPCAEFHRYR